VGPLSCSRLRQLAIGSNRGDYVIEQSIAEVGVRRLGAALEALAGCSHERDARTSRAVTSK